MLSARGRPALQARRPLPIASLWPQPAEIGLRPRFQIGEVGHVGPQTARGRVLRIAGDELGVGTAPGRSRTDRADRHRSTAGPPRSSSASRSECRRRGSTRSWGPSDRASCSAGNGRLSPKICTNSSPRTNADDSRPRISGGGSTCPSEITRSSSRTTTPRPRSNLTTSSQLRAGTASAVHVQAHLRLSSTRRAVGADPPGSAQPTPSSRRAR